MWIDLTGLNRVFGFFTSHYWVKKLKKKRHTPNDCRCARGAGGVQGAQRAAAARAERGSRRRRRGKAGGAGRRRADGGRPLRRRRAPSGADRADRRRRRTRLDRRRTRLQEGQVPSSPLRQGKPRSKLRKKNWSDQPIENSWENIGFR